LGTGTSVHHRIISAVQTAEFVSSRVSHILLRDRRCNITVTNAQWNVDWNFRASHLEKY
jgi:hypothetical protein